MPDGISPLAHILGGLHAAPARPGAVFGVAVHQMGSDIVERAVSAGADPLTFAAEYYLKPDSYFAHYVVGYDGEVVQVCDDTQKALHVGFQPADRALFLDGGWVDKLPPEVVSAWRAHWPGLVSPAHAFPGPSPNAVYVGIELIPIVDGCGAAPAHWLPAAKFTAEQHEAVVDLCVDIGRRHTLPTSWAMTARLTTHEDLNPLQRTTRKPPAGWDPGWLRPEPWFDLGWVRLQLSGS